MKGITICLVVFIAMVTEIRSASVRDIHPIQSFNCKGKADGNYLHPTDCTRFMSCSANVASERDCPPCDHNLDPIRCKSTNRLVYSDTQDTCVWADQTECKVGGDSVIDHPTTESTESEATDRPEVSPITEHPANGTSLEGKPCDPKLCKTEGDCLHYFRCDPVSKIWIKEKCGTGLLWNPNGSNGKKHIHGGNCGDPKKLDIKTLESYWKDPKCLECHWEEIEECSARYLYQPPNLFYPDEQELECDAGLVFVKAKGTCLRCQDVMKSDGTYCC